MMSEFWKGKKVFLTGHTGFKGSWLSLWLHKLGAEVHGYALAPNTNPNLFRVANVIKCLASSTIEDIRHPLLLNETLQASGADIVFHLAAQPLVRYSYESPVETYSVNVMGTVNLFEAIRKTGTVKAVVNVTTDKCYDNHGGDLPYREDEAMGGFDPYSSSKGCSELVTSSYRQSFFAEKGIALASARAGNVIGGGDWSVDRLIPDFLQALDKKEELVIRSPCAIRPWQHLLEPLCGYLQLAERLFTERQTFAQAWNFGPAEKDAKTVEWIVKKLVEDLPNAKWRIDDSPQPHEAHYLRLDSTKANTQLNWQPKWSLETALVNIMAWHQAWNNKEDMHQFSLGQIANYQKAENI